MTNKVDKEYWEKIASFWLLKENPVQGVKVGEDDGTNAAGISDEDLIPFDQITDEDIEDILSDLGLDDF